uniref:Uncharacterized protein n=1 Tax=Arundo donax TaxID=35708 RepID=A0A0A9FYV3_ARUDO
MSGTHRRWNHTATRFYVASPGDHTCHRCHHHRSEGFFANSSEACSSAASCVCVCPCGAPCGLRATTRKGSSSCSACTSASFLSVTCLQSSRSGVLGLSREM